MEISATRGRTAVLGSLLALALAGGACSPTGGGGSAADGQGSGAGVASAADSAVAAWIRAAGGMEAWRDVGSLRYTVTTVWYDSTEAVRRMRPRRVEITKTPDGFMSRIERPEAEGLYVQAFTGDTIWATLNGHPLPPDHPAVEESEYVGRDVYYWIGLPYKLRDPGVNLDVSSAGPEGLEVRVTFGGDVGQHPGDQYFYRFLDGDPTPEEVHYVEQGTEGRTRTLWRDFRDAGPLTYVGTRRYVDASGRTTMELRIDDVWIDPPLPDSLFRPPTEG